MQRYNRRYAKRRSRPYFYRQPGNNLVKGLNSGGIDGKNIRSVAYYRGAYLTSTTAYWRDWVMWMNMVPVGQVEDTPTQYEPKIFPAPWFTTVATAGMASVRQMMGASSYPHNFRAPGFFDEWNGYRQGLVYGCKVTFTVFNQPVTTEESPRVRFTLWADLAAPGTSIVTGPPTEVTSSGNVAGAGSYNSLGIHGKALTPMDIPALSQRVYMDWVPSVGAAGGYPTKTISAYFSVAKYWGISKESFRVDKDFGVFMHYLIPGGNPEGDEIVVMTQPVKAAPFHVTAQSVGGKINEALQLPIPTFSFSCSVKYYVRVSDRIPENFVLDTGASDNYDDTV